MKSLQNARRTIGTTTMRVQVFRFLPHSGSITVFQQVPRGKGRDCSTDRARLGWQNHSAERGCSGVYSDVLWSARGCEKESGKNLPVCERRWPLREDFLY